MENKLEDQYRSTEKKNYKARMDMNFNSDNIYEYAKGTTFHRRLSLTSSNRKIQQTSHPQGKYAI